MLTSDPAPIIPPAPHNPAGPTGAEGASFRPAAPAAGPHGAHGAPLGRRTRIVSAPHDPEARRAAISRRYRLQDRAAQILHDQRVTWCARHPVGDQVSVIYHPDTASASYGGLAVCGSVWTCPMCGAKIAGRRSDELARGAAAWRAQGGYLAMLTLTIRHQRGEPLEHLVRALNAAYRKIRQGRRFMQFKQDFGLVGTVTGREITYGKNGWHPHLHALLFVKQPLGRARREDMRQWIHKAWSKALGKLGLSVTYEHGARVTAVTDGGERYIAKTAATWSITQEMVKGLSKEGRHGNKTPAELLDLADKGKRGAAKLYREYAEATRGLNMLVWSPGLKALLIPDEPELTDQEIAEESISEGIETIVLTKQQWYTLLNLGLRADLLLQCTYADADRMYVFCESIGILLAPWQLKYTVRDRRRQDNARPGMPEPQLQDADSTAGTRGEAAPVLFTQLSIQDG